MAKRVDPVATPERALHEIAMARSLLRAAARHAPADHPLRIIGALVARALEDGLGNDALDLALGGDVTPAVLQLALDNLNESPVWFQG